jgi:5-methylcytosine-specific restriction endonuclease McrA
MNAKKFRGWCSAGCAGLIKAGAKKYCSFKCQQTFRRRERTQLLESGRYIAMQVTPFLRRYLINRLGEKCARCGWAERHTTTKKVPIEVEHIDGNWQNYRLENLTLLCPNCHALTPTFRGLNRGRGRGHRLGGRGNPIGQLASARATRSPLIKKVPERSLPQLALLPPT